jgi:WD40 repeat protein
MSDPTDVRLRFEVTCHDEDAESAPEVWQATLFDRGLLLARGDLPQLFIPVGSRVQDRGNGWFRVDAQGDRFQLRVRGWLTHRAMLAADVCAFLTGKSGASLRNSYTISLGLVFLALVPPAIAALAVYLGIPATGDGTLHGILWGSAGLALSAWSLTLVWDPQRSRRRQALVSLTLTLLVGGSVIAAWLAESRLPPPSIPPSAWQTKQGRDFTIDLPTRSIFFQELVLEFWNAHHLPGYFRLFRVDGWRGQMRFEGYNSTDDGHRQWDLARPSNQKRFEEMERNVLSLTSSTTVLSTDRLSISGWEGREWVLQGDNGLSVARFLVDREAGVLLCVSGRRLIPESPVIRTFLDSVQLPPAQGAIAAPTPWLVALENPRNAQTEALFFTEEGTRIIALDRLQSLVKVWDARTGKRLHTQALWMPGGKGGYYSWVLSASADGKVVVVGSGRTLGLCSPATGEVLSTHRLPGDIQNDEIASLQLSADGKTLCLDETKDLLRIWDVPTRQSKKERIFHDGRLVGFSPDGAVVVVLEKEHLVFWRWRDDAVERIDMKDDLGTPTLTYTPDGQRFAMLPAGRLHLFDAGKKEVVQRVSGPALAFAFSRHGKLLALGDARGNLRLRERNANGNVGKVVHSAQLPPQWQGNVAISSLAFSPDDRYLVVGQLGGAVVVDVSKLPRPKVDEP